MLETGATLSQSASPKFSIFKSIYDMTDEDISRWTQHKLQLASTAPPATTFVAVRNRSHSKSDIESGIIPGASSKTVIRKEEAPELGRKSGLTRDIDKANRAAGIGSMKTEHGGDADERRRRFDSWTVGEDLDGSLNRSQSGDVEIGNNDSGLMPMLAPPFDDSPRKSGVVPSASSPSLLATVWDIQGQKRKTTNALAASATNLLIRRNSLSKKDLKLISGDSRRPSGNFNDRELLHKEFSFISGFKPPTLAEPSQKNEPDNDDMILTEFLVIDFTQVLGVDATAARTCFLMLVQLMKSADVTVVFANMSPAVESLFQCHSVLQNGDVVVIPHLDDALEWCEEQVLYRFVVILHFKF